MGLETCYDGPLEFYQPLLQPTHYWIGSISSEMVENDLGLSENKVYKYIISSNA